MKRIPIAFCAALFAVLVCFGAAPVLADTFFFSTGNPDGKIGTASRPESSGKIEIESADDFILSSPTNITNATFTGLLTGGAAASDVKDVVVEIYRVFPKDSDTARTPRVPTRVNSPSDVAFTSRDSAANTLSYSTTLLSQSFTAANSVLNGINPLPNQHTGGEGPVTGKEVRFNVNFTTPFSLPTDHYFFVPQVELASGEFFWLSAPKPIVPPGTPFTPDLQSWIRNSNLDPDWLRIGTDIIGGQAFNATFSLSGETVSVPEPSIAMVLIPAFGALAVLRRRFSR
ncbi:MAG TPA: hypothetical protein VF790_13345 [Dissulfurispiraceae bacterium]